MGYEESSGFCSRCNKNVLIRKKSPSYLLHFILIFITGGIWLIVLIFVFLLSYSPWRCSQCGAKVSTGIFALMKNNNVKKNLDRISFDEKKELEFYRRIHTAKQKIDSLK